MTKEREEFILDDYDNCIDPCTDIVSKCKPEIDGPYKVVDLDYLVRMLPGMNYVKNRALSYIFSNGLTAGGETDDEKLDKWLYEKRNPIGASNFHVLREAIGNAIVYGECGLRRYGNNLYVYEKGHFGILYDKQNGVTQIEAYFIRKDGDLVDEDLDKSEWDQFESYSDIVQWFDDRKLILLDPTEFVNLRSDMTKLHGLSPLLQDTQRVRLLLAVYERLNYDIRYDGPGRIILFAKSRNDTDEDQSTTSVITNGTGPARESIFAKALKEAKRVAQQIKKSSSDQVITLSDGFEKDIKHLPRVTKATEFMDWINNEGVIIAQILGMSAVLVEVGKWSGNVSMEKVIDDAMLNTIVPFREVYAVQFSPLVSRIVGVPKVFFNKYDSSRAEEENAARQKIANVIRDLSVSAKNVRADGGDIETADNLDKLITEVSEVLRKSLYDDNGNVRAL